MIKLKLIKPLIIFDLEGTGLDVANDRICSIAIFKVWPDGKTEVKKSIINPERIMSDTVIAIHGITNEMALKAPTFKQLSKGIAEFMCNCDWAGYGSDNYDVPLLVEEFLRCGIEDCPSENTNMVDVGSIFKIREPRTLTAALKFYCGKDLEGAHDAENDTIATYEVLKSQLTHYPDLTDISVDELAKISKMKDTVDYAGKFGKDSQGDYIYLFGNSRNTRVKDDTGLAVWLLSKDFPAQTKRVCMRILDEIEQSKRKVSNSPELGFGDNEDQEDDHDYSISPF